MPELEWSERVTWAGCGKQVHLQLIQLYMRVDESD